MLVSILLAVYNGETYLKEAIDSLLAQSFKDFELIVVDDGSTDGTATILAAYTDTRLRVLTAEKNAGLIASLNWGVSVARGKYLARLDADDVAMPDRLENQVRYLDQHPEVALLGTGALLIDSAGKALYPTYYQQSIAAIPTHLLFRNVFIHSSIMVKTEVLRRFPFDPTYYLAEDYIVWVQIAEMYQVVALQDAWVQHRIHENNITTVKQVQHLQTVHKIYAYQLQKLDIEAKEEELVLHKKIGNYQFDNNLAFVEQTAHWLWRLVEQNRKHKIYDLVVFEQWILQLWVDSCLHNRNLGTKLARLFWQVPVSNLLPKWRKYKLLFGFILQLQ